MAFLTAAFADDAFEAPDLRTPSDLFRLRVMPPQKSYEIRFKRSVLTTPLFRGKDGGHMKFATVNDQLKRVGKLTGFKGNLTSYSLRRGVANGIHGTPYLLTVRTTLTL
jgi:hypothetical protein